MSPKHTSYSERPLIFGYFQAELPLGPETLSVTEQGLNYNECAGQEHKNNDRSNIVKRSEGEVILY